LYYITSLISEGALVHLYFSSLPIDLWVVVLEPGIAEDHALLSKAGDSEECPFRIGFVAKNYIYYFRDLTCLIEEELSMLYTGMGQKMLWMLIFFI